MVDTVNATWKFASKGSDMFIRAMVQQFPSAALLTESGQHVGHMVGEHYGPMGMLYVQPEFRGQGLAKVIVTNLAQKYFGLGEDAYVIVETTNEKSLKLHQSVGFKVVPDIMVAWLGCGPQNSEPSD
nr:hypothetical protein BaRGS_017297 [Batillaria attramentaria]